MVIIGATLAFAPSLFVLPSPASRPRANFPAHAETSYGSRGQLPHSHSSHTGRCAWMGALTAAFLATQLAMCTKPSKSKVTRFSSENLEASKTVEGAQEEEDDLDSEWVPPPPFDPAEQIGAMPPLGYFDPLGFCKVGDRDGFRKYRFAEIKHGRIAMMAATGAVFAHFIQLPGFEGRTTLGSIYMGAFSAPGIYGANVLLYVVALLELGAWQPDDTKEPGDFGDPLGFGMYDDEMRAREINNGRFAMFAALGIVAAQAYTGKDAVEQLGLGL